MFNKDAILTFTTILASMRKPSCLRKREIIKACVQETWLVWNNNCTQECANDLSCAMFWLIQ